jgi:hypothetical protein
MTIRKIAQSEIDNFRGVIVLKNHWQPICRFSVEKVTDSHIIGVWQSRKVRVVMSRKHLIGKFKIVEGEYEKNKSIIPQQIEDVAG